MRVMSDSLGSTESTEETGSVVRRGHGGLGGRSDGEDGNGSELGEHGGGRRKEAGRVFGELIPRLSSANRDRRKAAWPPVSKKTLFLVRR